MERGLRYALRRQLSESASESPARHVSGDSSRARRQPLMLGGVEIAPGERVTVSVQVARLYTHSRLDIPVHVVHGRRPGPRLFVSGVLHGDEINGVEIIRRLLRLKALRRLRGTLLAVPVVNVFGFINQTRYLPDRRDLNRFFPGSESGSLTSRVANVFMEEVVADSTHGIDLHTGSHHRTNLPQVRACLDDPETEELAHVFGAPVILDANLRDGSLRQAGVEMEIPMLLYEGGEAFRFNEFAIRAGLGGVVRVMRHIGMLPPARQARERRSLVAHASVWVRAPISGILHDARIIGSQVEKGEVLGTVSDPFGEGKAQVHATCSGLVIGRQLLPLVHQGDALFHIARIGDQPGLDEALEGLRQELSPDLDRAI